MALELVNSKLRLYLSTDHSTHRKFYWFELKENDLYWGSSAFTKEEFCTLEPKTSNSFSIQTSNDFKKLKLSKIKYSYHQSGQFHLKRLTDGRYQAKEIKAIWNKKDEILKPLRIYSLITKPFFNYPIENKKLTRDGSSGRAILLEGKAGFNRLFMEFFITPLGEHPLPEPLINFGKIKFSYINRPLSSELVLITRYIKLANLENWHPDNEIIFLGCLNENCAQ